MEFIDMQRWLEKAANRLEQRFEDRYENSGRDIPTFDGVLEIGEWYRVPIKEGMAGDGSEYHIYIRKGKENKVCYFLSGGGMAWNAYTAARPITVGKIVSNQPNYYYNNLRPATERMNVGGGITDIERKENPLKDWSFVIVTYATGDFHIGNHVFTYKDEKGNEQLLHFHGKKNFEASMRFAKSIFPNPETILFAGDSAGGFAVSALSREVVNVWYPQCPSIFILSDAAMLTYAKWKHTIKEVWQSEASFYSDLESDNITLEWYKKLLKEKHPNVHCLYCGSIHDYLLTTYFNDLKNKEWKTTPEIQEHYRSDLKAMVKELLSLDPTFSFYIHDMSMPLSSGTIHTSLRHNWVYMNSHENLSIAQWLEKAMQGLPTSIGLDLL